MSFPNFKPRNKKPGSKTSILENRRSKSVEIVGGKGIVHRLALFEDEDRARLKQEDISRRNYSQEKVAKFRY
jgi:hypothetical protein